jgi:predicted GIY-YIG superfamily endonuclease
MGTGRAYWVYILASDVGGTLYVGVTNDLIRRVHEHRTDAIDGFSRRYSVHRLVYYEQFDQIERDSTREATQEMDSRLEGRADREDESELGRSVCSNRRAVMCEIARLVATGSPGQAGR